MTVVRVFRNRGSVAQGGGVSDVTVTYDLATEESEGHGGGIAWQSVFLLNDGRIVSFGTGDHGFESSNAVRIIDPVTTPGSVSTSVLWPWTQAVMPPNSSTGSNLYVSNHDNHPSIYLPSDNKAIWFGHGVFDFATEVWTHGNRSPLTNTWDDFIDASEVPNLDAVYNPGVAWCHALDKGVLYGNSAGGSGQAYNQMSLIERISPGGSWRVNAVTISGAKEIMRARNESFCVGKYLYLGGNEPLQPGDQTGDPFFQKIDLETLTFLEELTPATRDEDEDFPQTVYDSARHKAVRIGIRLQEYDIATDVWTDITPVGWPGYTHPMGVYHPTLNAIFFRGIPVGAGIGVVPSKFRWHRIEFPQDGFSRWALVPQDTNASPFQGAPEESFGGTKHVKLVWHPVKERVYTFGGDYGNGAGQFSGQPNMGSDFTTNEPSGANTFERDSSLCNDMYSIDPYASGTVPWRLEHPYKVRDMGGGTREQRPGRPDQAAFFYDSARAKLWALYSVLRTEFLYLDTGVPDLWANGDMTTSAPFEPIATYSFAPGVSGSPGTFTVETTKRLIYRSGGTSYSGDLLISGIGDERIGIFEYDAHNDVGACLSAAAGGGQALFTFHPANIGGATNTIFQYRTFSVSGYSRMDCSGSYCAMVDGWAHAVAIATTSGGTRKSVMLRVNVTAALAVANEGVVPSGAIEVIDLPWSLSPGNVWENSGDASSKWQEHCGVVNVFRTVVLVKSYDGIVEDGVTKLATWDPDTRIFTSGEDAPDDDIHLTAWCALPKTAEWFGAHNTSGIYSNLNGWRYRVY